MILIVLHLLRVLSLGELPQHTWSVPLKPGHIYQIRRVTAEADGPFCLSTIEERSGKEPNRALSLGCWAGGRAEIILRETAVKGRRGAAYSVILFVGPPPTKAAESVVLTMDVERK